VQWLRSELLGPEGSISRIVPVAFSLQAVKTVLSLDVAA